jgi:hypothetical protein
MESDLLGSLFFLLLIRSKLITTLDPRLNKGVNQWKVMTAAFASIILPLYFYKPAIA